MSRCAPIDVFDVPWTVDKPYIMDWTEWLVGAILTAATVTVTGEAGIIDTHDLDYTVAGSTQVRIWVRGLATGTGEAFVTLGITASDGRKDAQTWRFDVCSP